MCCHTGMPCPRHRTWHPTPLQGQPVVVLSIDLVGCVFTSHRQRGHLETAPPFTVPCEGLEARSLHHSHRESNPRPSRGSPLHWNITLKCTTTHSNVLGQTWLGNPYPTFHTVNAQLHDAGMVVVSQEAWKTGYRTHQFLNLGPVVRESVTLSAPPQLNFKV